MDPLNSLHVKWHALNSSYHKAVEIVGSKFGIVKLRPKVKNEIRDLAQEAMKAALSETPAELIKLSPHSNPAKEEKLMKSTRHILKEALKDATIQSMKAIAEEQGISNPSQIEFSKAVKNPVFHQVLEEKLGKPFQQTVSHILEQGATEAERKIYRDILELHAKLESNYEETKSLTENLAILEDQFPDEGLREPTVQKFIDKLKRQLDEFNNNATILSNRFKNTDPQIKRNLRISHPHLQADIEKFSSIPQEQRAKGLIRLAGQIKETHQIFENEGATPQTVEKNSNEWKNFEKDIVAFVQAMNKPQAGLYKQQNSDERKEIYAICDYWNIDYK